MKYSKSHFVAVAALLSTSNAIKIKSGEHLVADMSMSTSSAAEAENQALANAFAAITSKSEAKLLAEQRIQNQNKNSMG